ncbi:MAG: hypothetical protein ACTSUF_03645 [Candidatus Heimdallarchaeaceae archaeon]
MFGIGFGIVYLIANISRITRILLPNIYGMDAIVHVNIVNKDTKWFNEFDVHAKLIDENLVIPLRLPYGRYDISFHLPNCLIKRFNDVLIYGFDIEFTGFVPVDMNNDNRVGMAELTMIADNYGKVGDEPVAPIA